MGQKGVHWLEQILKQSCGKEFTEGYKQLFDKAKQMEHDNTRRIAYNAYCAAQCHDLDASESKFDKFFKESYD